MYLCLHEKQQADERRTVSIDHCSLPTWVLQFQEQGALGIQVLVDAAKRTHLVLCNIGEDGNIKIYIITPARQYCCCPLLNTWLSIMLLTDASR